MSKIEGTVSQPNMETLDQKARRLMKEMAITLGSTLDNVVTAVQPLKETIKKDGWSTNAAGKGDSYCIHRLLTAMAQAQVASLDAAKVGLDLQLKQLGEMIDIFNE